MLQDLVTLVLDLVTLVLDLIALERGYRRPMAPGHRAAVSLVAAPSRLHDFLDFLNLLT